MRRYFWSIGFDLFYKVYDLDNNLVRNFDKKETNNLKEIFMNLKTPYLRYELSFDNFNQKYSPLCTQ